MLKLTAERDATKPFTRNDMPILVQEVVTTLILQWNTQTTSLTTNNEKQHFRRMIYPTLTVTGMFAFILITLHYKHKKPDACMHICYDFRHE